jgi:putative ABC transport system permease protein
MRRLAQADPGPEDDHRAFAAYLSETTTRGVRQTLLILMGAAGLVLALACANVASLLLVRGSARMREMAIRTAIGAGRARVARQLITEHLTVAAIGGGLGVLLAGLCLRMLVLAGPRNIPRLGEASLNVPVLLFGAAVTVVVAILAGAAPVFHAGRVDPAAAMKEGTPGAGAGRRGQSLRAGLVVAEIAITVVLAFASGLLLRSLITAVTSFPGFEAGHLLALDVQLPASRYGTDESTRQFYGRLVQNLRGTPGVESAAAASCLPSAGSCGDWWYSIADRPAPARGDVVRPSAFQGTPWFNPRLTLKTCSR